MASFEWPSSGGGILVVATAADLPASASPGTLAVTEDTDSLYVFDGNTHMWVEIATPGLSPPGGASGSVQYNNAGAFAGFGNWNGSTLAVPGNITGNNFENIGSSTMFATYPGYQNVLSGISQFGSNDNVIAVLGSYPQPILGSEGLGFIGFNTVTGNSFGFPGSLGFYQDPSSGNRDITFSSFTNPNFVSLLNFGEQGAVTFLPTNPQPFLIFVDGSANSMAIGTGSAELDFSFNSTVKFYMNATGVAFNEAIQDTSNTGAVNTNTRRLYASDGTTPNLDWNTPGEVGLFYNGTSHAFDVTFLDDIDSFQSYFGLPGILLGNPNSQNPGVITVDTNGSLYLDGGNFTQVNPPLQIAQFVQDTSGFESIDANGRNLFYSDGVTSSLNWLSSEATTPSGIASFVWSSNNGVQFNAGIADWTNAFLSIDTNNRLLVAPDGATTVIDYTKSGFNSSAALSFDGTDNVHTQFSLIVHSFIQDTSFVSSIDANNRNLMAFDGTTVVLSFFKEAPLFPDYTLALNPDQGMIAYDFINNTPIYYDGTSWIDLGGGGGPGLWAFSSGSGANTIVENGPNNYVSIGDANGDGLSALSVFQASNQNPNYAQAWYGNAGNLFLGFPGGQPFFSSTTGPIVIASTNLQFDMSYIVDLSNGLSIDPNGRSLEGPVSGIMLDYSEGLGTGSLSFPNAAVDTSGSGLGTLSNVPGGTAGGNPTGYLVVFIGGVQSYIPYWQ